MSFSILVSFQGAKWAESISKNRIDGSVLWVPEVPITWTFLVASEGCLRCGCERGLGREEQSWQWISLSGLEVRVGCRV